MVAPYPWQNAQWGRLCRAAQRGKLSHANLLSGRRGVGHGEFAIALAQFLLCEEKGDAMGSCGACRSCTLFVAGNHPDLMQLVPEEEGKAITIEQVRNLSEFYALKPHYGGHKVATVSPADALNRASSNAILKTLEEPPSEAVLILVTDRFDAIPMTIRSRCQRIAFEHVDLNEARTWLHTKVPQGIEVEAALLESFAAPLGALDLLNDGQDGDKPSIAEAWAGVANGRITPLNAAKACGGTPIAQVFEELLRLSYSMIHAQSGVSGELSGAQLRSQEKPEETLHASVNGLNLKDLYKILDVITEAKSLVLGQSNVRESDLLDSFWVALDRVYRLSNGV